MIPFLDVKQINKRFEKEYQEAFQTFLNSGSYILGNQLTKFENEFASFCGTKYCLGVGNGLDAISLIFKGYLQLGKLQVGDKVLVPANTYIASISAIQLAGLKPVLVDAEEESYNICIKDLKQKITPDVKAVLLVHLYGCLSNIKAINLLAKENSLLVIEDAAQAHGALSVESKRTGNLANAGAFSFYPSKNLGALADGGAITTNDKSLFETVSKLRNYGGSVKYQYDLKGLNSRLDEIQAYFLSIKLPYLDKDNLKRIEIAKTYNEGINNPNIVKPKFIDNKSHVYYAYVIRCKRRDELQDFLRDNGVQTVIHYPIPTHKQLAFKEFEKLNLPVTERLHDEVLSLPISPIQTKEVTIDVIEILNKFK